MGDKVTIRVVSANLDKRQLDYEWIEKSASPEKRKKRTGKKPKKEKS